MFHPDGNRLGRRGIFYLPQAIATSEFQASTRCPSSEACFFSIPALKLRSLKVTALLTPRLDLAVLSPPAPAGPDRRVPGLGHTLIFSTNPFEKNSNLENVDADPTCLPVLSEHIRISLPSQNFL